jgi:DNA-binding transcriptional ArsR family regulator
MAKELRQSTYCAEQLKALSEPLRLRIVSLLREGPQSVSDLSDALKTELATVSHHLQILRNAGIVMTQRKGRFVWYSLEEGVFKSATSATGKEHIDLGCCRLELPKAFPTD